MIADLAEFSLFVGLVVLLLMLLAGSVRFRPSSLRGVPRSKRLKRFGRYVLIRLPIAIGFALAVFVLGLAALTLNSHRPPADNSPVVQVARGSSHVSVTIDLQDCGESAHGAIRVERTGRPAAERVGFYSDAGGTRRLDVTTGRRFTRAAFDQEKPTQKRSLLSCYMQLPVVKGSSGGYEVKLRLSDEMEVDRDSSVPAPGAYARGLWVWKCLPGRRCPAFAAINYSVEDGTKQVIVLVLASIFGALIALLAGEVLISWARRRFGGPGSSSP